MLILFTSVVLFHVVALGSRQPLFRCFHLHPLNKYLLPEMEEAWWLGFGFVLLVLAGWLALWFSFFPFSL